MPQLSDIIKPNQYQSFSVLVVDDEVGMQTVLKKALGKFFNSVDCAGSIEEAETLRINGHYDLIVLDINLPGRSGIEWEEAFNDPQRPADVIFMTGYANLETAISALQLGASDFVLKPFNLDQMLQAVKRCMNKRLTAQHQMALKHDAQRNTCYQIIGGSESTKQLKLLISQFAPSRASVLIEGESGTGKELVARGIHTHSERKGPFVAINCGAIAPELLESELFGHIAGSFTGAKKNREGLFRMANTGTLFLDEIGEMPLSMQAALLRVLEQRTIRPVGSEKELPVNVRVVAATNRNLKQEVEQGRFRGDLYYRLNVLKIEVPPLRSRINDLIALVPHFTRLLSHELGMAEPKWQVDDMLALQKHEWPGNIRELKNLIERSILLNDSPANLLVSHLNTTSLSNISMNVSSCIGLEALGPESLEFGYPDNWTLKEVEKVHIQQVVDSSGGNKSAAARKLGVARKTLERKFKDWENDELDYA